jgi:ADP-ribose pyrophosphatase YjhB (NUDIX family)
MEARQVFGRLPEGWERRLLIEHCPRCGSLCDNVLISGMTRSRCAVCAYVHFVNPSPGVVVVVESDDRVLLCRRGKGTGQDGRWCLPGGHIEYHEDFITAGLREVEEEAGIQVEIKGILSLVSNFWDHGDSTFVAVLLAQPLGGEPHPDGRETTDVAWFEPNDLPPDEMAFAADVHIIERYFSAREPGAPVDPAFVRLAGRDPDYAPPPASRHPW